MKRISLTAIALILATTNPLFAQNAIRSEIDRTVPTGSAPRSNVPPVVQAKNRSISLNFRLPDWQTFHSQDDSEAKETMETLQGIGCEVKREQHVGHIDIRYRCENWKPLKLDTQQQLTEWQTWLTKKGIDSIVLNPGPQTSLPTVSFRMSAARSAHIHDYAQAEALEETFKMLGCEIATNAHNGHIDLAVQCKDWITIGLSSESSAHAWQDWLKQNGFETQHPHK